MIDIKNKQDCCGCSACAQRCPKQCITMAEDEEGFLYPKVDTANCIDCHLCEKVCPVINQYDTRTPLNVYAAKNPDDTIRMNSSSGGVFTILAEQVINTGGVVFGACWDDEWNIKHDYAECVDDLAKFRSSKYVQSRIGEAYSQVKCFLDGGRNVLFSGTPCQIAGLKLFLCKNYDNLLTVECVCHGVPSPGLWQQYLKEQTAKDERAIIDITKINFRNKETGWKRYSISIDYEDGKRYIGYHGENPWTKSFINNLNLRPSCTSCPSKCVNSQADITLGDFWGIGTLLENMDDDKGYSLILCHTEKGKNALTGIKMRYIDFAKVIPFNKALINSSKENSKRGDFFKSAFLDFFLTVDNMTKPSFVLRVKLFVAKLIK